MSLEPLDSLFRVYNKVIDKVDFRQLLPPPDTRPIISDFSFQLQCGFRILSVTDFSKLRTTNFAKSTYKRGLYLSPDLLTEFKFQLNTGDLEVDCFDYLLIGRQSKIGDYSISRANLEGINSSFKKVWVQQLSQEFDNVRALPVGIEDLKYPAGKRFRKLFKYSESSRRVSKVHRFLIAWNDDTNREERTRVRNLFQDIEGALVLEHRITVQTLHRLMRQTVFVICPRGAAGWDTHRVWEALYCGATPVLCGPGIPSSAQSWPIVVLRDWNEIISRPEEFFSEHIVKSKRQSMEFNDFQTKLWANL